MASRKKVLFLAGWRTDFGDFIVEHFKAVGKYHDAQYVYIEFQKKFSLFPLYRIRETHVNNDPDQILITVSCFLRRFGVFDALVNLALNRVLRRHSAGFDLVHVNVRTPETEAMVLNKHLPGIPKVLTEHNTFYHTKINHQFPDPILRAREKERIINWFAEADFVHVMPVSRQLGIVLAEEYGIPAERIRVVPNVAAAEYLVPANPLPHEDVRLLLVAFWTGTKNLMLFAHALAQLDRAELDRLHVDLVGEGDLVPEFLRFVKKKLPSLKLVTHGFVNDPRTLAQLYRAADFLVHPSDAENLPCVIIESLCCGTPVLSNAVNGINELIEPGVNGLLGPQGDVPAFTMHLKQIVAGQVNLDRQAIQRRAIAQFSPEEVGRQLSSVYMETLSTCGERGEERPYQQCTNCILDTRDDRAIQFDEAGVCGYCNRYTRLVGQRLFRGVDRQKELEVVLSRIKKDQKHPKYDCLAGVSGGVDSSYVALKLKQLGLTPLLVHLDNGWNSDLAERNMKGIVDKLQFDLHRFTPDADEFRDIQLAFLKASVVDIELPTDHAVVAYLYDLAGKLGIKYIISGDNFATEGVMPKGWSHDKKDLRNIRAIVWKYARRRLRSLPRLNYLRRQYLLFYKGIKVVPLLNYLDYDKDAAKQEIATSLGWTDYGSKHGESNFTRFYQNYILPVKFHVDKRKAHLSTLICSGQMDRRAALAELDKPIYPPGQLQEDKELVLAKLGLSQADFDAIMIAPVNQHTDLPSYATSEYRWERAIRKRLRPLIKFIKAKTGLRVESNYV